MRFSTHIPYLFWANNIHEKQKLSDNISVAVRIRPSSTNKRVSPLTAGQVRADVRSNPDLPEKYYSYMRNIRGTPAYWNTGKLDLLAMIKKYGPPTFFITFSANDMYWDDLLTVICMLHNLPHTPEDLSIMPKSFRVKLMNKNPIITARHFNHRYTTFLSKVILSKEEPIGPVYKRYDRVEFQMRGSPHIHSL